MNWGHLPVSKNLATFSSTHPMAVATTTAWSQRSPSARCWITPRENPWPISTAIYRDGKLNGRILLIKRNPPKARALYDQLKVKLSPGARTFEEFLLDVSVAPPGKYREYYDRLQKIHVRDRPSLVRQLRTINPGIYSYVVQAQLQRRGLLKGAPNGRMTANTVRVMRQYCGLIGTPYFCSNDPMSSQFSELLSYTF